MSRILAGNVLLSCSILQAIVELNKADFSTCKNRDQTLSVTVYLLITLRSDTFSIIFIQMAINLKIVTLNNYYMTYDTL